MIADKQMPFGNILFSDLPVATRIIRILESGSGEVRLSTMFELCECTEAEFQEAMGIVMDKDNTGVELIMRLPKKAVK